MGGGSAQKRGRETDFLGKALTRRSVAALH
jgi:hypothetical protein